MLAILDAVFTADREGADHLRRVVVTGLGEGLNRTGGSLGEFLRTAAPSPQTAGALADLFTARQAQALQLAAIQALSALQNAEVGNLLIEHWRSFSPAVRREVVEALFSRADRLPALIRSGGP
jgi:hypothetical protein